MKVSFTFRQMDANDALKDHAENKLQRLTRFEDRELQVEGVFNNHDAVSRCALVGLGDRPNQVPCVVIELHDGHIPDKDLRDKQWGLLRLLHSPYGTFSGDDSGDIPTYRCVWEFKSPDSQYFYLQAEITPQKKDNPFNQDVFTDFAMTGKVSK